MAHVFVLPLAHLPPGTKKTVHLAGTEILVIHHDRGISAVQAKCPHAGAPLEEGAICNGRLVCPWHLGTFAISTGELLEPPPMEPLNTFSVKVEGEGIFVDPEPRRTEFAKRTHSIPVFLIVGTGAAGAMAATTLRLNGFEGRIIAVDPVAEEPVDRTQCSKDALGGEFPLEKLPLNTFNKVQVERLKESVNRLSSVQREAELSRGAVLKFDKALLATGGRPKRLEVPGAELAHVLRHPDDVRRIQESLQGKRNVVIVGTSFIGLEAASALVQQGFQVTVMGPEKQPLAKQMGDEVAGAIQTLHESKGTKFRLGVKITSITEEAVTIHSNGSAEQLPADLVIMGVGVSPDLGFRHDLSTAEKGGIRVGADLRAADDVWVAGDIASVDGLRIEHWRLAQQHGRVAALAMLGQQAKYEGVPFFWTYHFGKRIAYLGHAEEWGETFIQGDLAGMAFMAFYLKDGVVRAVASCGQESQTAALAEPMRDVLTLEEALRLVNFRA